MCRKHLAYLVEDVIVHNIYQRDGEMLIHIVEFDNLYSNFNQLPSGVKDLEIFCNIYGSQCHLLIGITQCYNYIYRRFFYQQRSILVDLKLQNIHIFTW
jgi:hypothetical protein